MCQGQHFWIFMIGIATSAFLNFFPVFVFCNTRECSICPVKVFAYVFLCFLLVNKWENKGGRSCHFWCAPGGTEILGGQETSRQPYSPPPPFHPKPRPPLLGSRRRLISALLPFSPILYIVIAENLVLDKLPLVNKSPVLLPNWLHHAAHPSSERWTAASLHLQLMSSLQYPPLTPARSN